MLIFTLWHPGGPRQRIFVNPNLVESVITDQRHMEVDGVSSTVTIAIVSMASGDKFSVLGGDGVAEEIQIHNDN